jgi:hypothetical protein
MNVAFTCITNNYDELKDPLVISEGWRYVAFCDKFIYSDVWECYVTEKHNRDIKIRPHMELFHELSLYVDGSIQIKGDLNQFITEVPTWFTLWKHPHRDNITQEANAIVKMKGINRVLVDQQLARYKKDGYTKNGLAACGVILRDLSDHAVRKICNTWWEEFERGVARDQISLPYAFWKHGFSMDLFNNDIFNKYFSWGKHL